MLLLLTGSSCAGKTTLGARCRELPDLAVHDSDEHGVPSDADTAWRQRDLEDWVQTALDLQRAGTDLLLTGQSPLGELLAVPSADALDAMAVCLVDVDDEQRRSRLAVRDGDRWPDDVVEAFVHWGRWHRGHAADPAYRPHVIIAAGWPAMRWDRWSDWRSDDPRWRVDVIDTSASPVDRTAAKVRDWVTSARTASRPAGPSR